MLTLCLDLEATLISNAQSQFPRPGLAQFLQHCLTTWPIVMIYTGLELSLARAVWQQMTTERNPEFGIPSPDPAVSPEDWERWLLQMPFVEFPKQSWCKDLRYVQEMFGKPQYPQLSYLYRPFMDEIFLVDDDPEWIHPAQREQWIPIQKWESPYPLSDQELRRVGQVLDAKREEAAKKRW